MLLLLLNFLLQIQQVASFPMKNEARDNVIPAPSRFLPAWAGTERFRVHLTVFRSQSPDSHPRKMENITSPDLWLA
jgi:hypothetical protein